MPAWVLWSTGNATRRSGYLDPPVLGFRLVEGRYVPVSVTMEGGILVGRSEVYWVWSCA